MKTLQIIIWPFFLVMFIIMAYQQNEFSNLSPKVPSAFALETANHTEANKILLAWDNACWHKINMLNGVRINTYTDFAFIISYVLLIIKLSADRMQQESYYPLNALLRLNFFLAVLAGLFDMIENGTLIYNIAHYSDDRFISSFYFTWIKWILLGFAVATWLVSFIKCLLFSKSGSAAVKPV